MPSCHRRTARPAKMLELVGDMVTGGELPKPVQKRIL